MSEKIIEILEENSLKEDIKGLVFDIIASNIGKEKGENSRLNIYLGRPVMHLACKHHVYECHIKNAAKLFRTTSGPENQLFKKLLDEFSLFKIDLIKLCKFKYGVNQQLDNAASIPRSHHKVVG